MSDADDRGWGDDDWLTDRSGRRRWMRMVTLNTLAEQILRTPARAELAIACVMDEVFADTPPVRPPTVRRCVQADSASAATWLKRAAARLTRRDRFRTVALVLPDGPPYGPHLALAEEPPQADHWPETITVRGDDELPLQLLATALPRTKKLKATVRAEADYILPLAYAAFLVRDVLRATPGLVGPRVSHAVAVYTGGNQLVVPLAT